eukprot:CAMPEP_0180304516 /NCGR_PEP_ID=MMETSP0988-20121125/25839_1 /TAXON_ID=697907 /ORGANISM="non described non described, Strain CCMP2293" /LENGTH=118 /DNA_ID=CAMNT_0022286697 /DNA_START=1 /DNA_END=357 /DNA_ORIENTATION=+
MWTDPKGFGIDLSATLAQHAPHLTPSTILAATKEKLGIKTPAGTFDPFAEEYEETRDIYPVLRRAAAVKAAVVEQRGRLDTSLLLGIDPLYDRIDFRMIPGASPDQPGRAVFAGGTTP